MTRAARFSAVGVVGSILLGVAARVTTSHSVLHAQTGHVTTSSQISGFGDSLALIADLLDRGRGIEAENIARLLLARVESIKGPEALEVAQVLDLLYRAVRRSSKVPATEKRAIVERAVDIKERTLDPSDPDLATSLINLGVQQTLDGNPAAAKPILERAVAIREAAFAPDHPAVAGALLSLGGLLMILHEDDQAKAVLERAQRIRERAYGAGHVDTVRTLVNLALVYQETGDYSSARNRYERALMLAEKLDRPDLLTLNVLTGAAVVLAELGGDYAGSARLNERLLTLSEQAYGSTDPRLRAPLENLAIDFREMGDYPKAKVFAERSVTIAEHAFAANGPEMAKSLRTLATIDAGMGNYAEAMRSFERATRINEEALGAADAEVGRVSGLIPDLFSLSGYGPDDTTLFQQALATGAVAAGLESASTREFLANLASVVSTSEDAKRMRPLFEMTLRAQEQLRSPDHPEVAAAATNLATVLSRTDDLSRARSLYDRALSIWEQSFGPDHPKVAIALVNLAGLLIKTGNYDDAKLLLTRALAIQQHKLGAEHPTVAATLVNLAEADAHTGAMTEAFDAAMRATGIRHDHIRLTARALPERQALAYASSNASGIDLMLTIASSQGADARQVTAAWNAIIRSRGMILDEMAARNRVASTTENPDVSALTQALTLARQRLAAAVVRGPGDTAPERYRLQLEQARKDKDRAEAELTEVSASFREDLSIEGVGLSEIAAALPDGTVLVAFVRFQRHRLEPAVASAPPRPDGDPSYVAFVMHGGGPPAVIPLGSTAKIDGLIAQWRRQLDQEAMAGGRSSRVSEEAFRSLAAQLRELIWDPLHVEVTNSTRVFIIPDGALHLVNFAAMPEGPSKYLVETGPLIHYLSAERDVVSMSTVLPAGTGLLALGGVAFDESNRTLPSSDAPHFRGDRSNCVSFQSMRFEPLPGSLSEVNHVVSLWNRANGAPVLHGAPGADVLRLTGRGASESALKSGAAGRRILHFATHGFFLGGDCPPTSDAASADSLGLATRVLRENPLLLSGLVLAGANSRNRAAPDQDDGVLTAEEVATLNLNGVEWVVLSGCDTGTGKVKVGEGVFGLQRAFQVAGARTVIMSLWPVDDQSTDQWMKALYYGRLMKKLSTADAIRQANLELLRQRRAKGLSTHPFYWAGFVAAGDWR